MHASLIQLPTRSWRTFVEPCGLWQELHSIFPSASGMCATRFTLVACVRWQLPHSSSSVAFFSCAFTATGSCTLWQVMHDMLRASCALPSQSACVDFVWHDRHVWLVSRGGIPVNRLIVVGSAGSST